MKHSRLVAATSLLAAGAIVLSGCDVPHTTMAYASEVVTCGGKPAITASGSTAQTNAMKRFVSAYGKACPGHTLNYTANGSGAGISDFLAGKSDFAGSDIPLSDDQYAAAKQRCGGSDAWNLPVVFGPLAITYNLYNVDFSHATPAQRRKVLNDMIREELFVQRGKELDVASTDPEVRNAMVNAVELEIASDAITSQPTEAALRGYYESHLERYASEGIMTVDDYIFPANSADASQAIEAFRSRPPTPDLIAQWGGRSSGKVGDEEFYFAAHIHLGARLFAAARALPQGGISDPIPMADGVHVLYMRRNVTPSPLDFVAARDKVMSDYRNERIRHLTIEAEAFLSKRAHVLIAADLR